jgi:hypothetical protein
VASTRALTLAGGKAMGRFAALSTLGATFPASPGLASIGHPIAWNSALEMHATQKLWVQFEQDSTFYEGGTHDGKKQSFATPGVFVSPMRPWSAASKTYLLLGVGMQIATTHYHSTDHNLVVDTKIYF